MRDSFWLLGRGKDSREICEHPRFALGCALGSPGSEEVPESLSLATGAFFRTTSRAAPLVRPQPEILEIPRPTTSRVAPPVAITLGSAVEIRSVHHSMLKGVELPPHREQIAGGSTSRQTHFKRVHAHTLASSTMLNAKKTGEEETRSVALVPGRLL